MLKLNWSGRRIALLNPVDASSTTLDEVLNLVSIQETDTPIPTILSSGYEDATLLYLRSCIPKGQWKVTTLNQLGIENGGSALLTLNLTVPNDSTATMASTSTFTAATPPPAPQPSTQSAAVVKNIDMVRDTVKAMPKKAVSNEATPMQISTAYEEPISQLTSRKAIEQLLSNNFDVDSKECCLALLKIVNNLLSRPDEPKFRSINVRNSAFNQKVVGKSGGLEFLYAIGFSLRNDSVGEYLILEAQDESQSTLEKARQELHQAATDLGISITELPQITIPTRQTTAARPQPPPLDFDVYRGQMFSIAAAAVGADPTTVAPDGNSYVSKIDRELNTLTAKTKQLEEEMQSKKMDREIVALLPVQSVSDESLLALDEGLSVKGDGALLSARVKRMVEETQKRESVGFTTKAMRDLDKIKQKKIYAFTKLRICFPDGITVYAKFYPSETVALVKEVLIKDVLLNACDFDFYVVPPRRALTLSKSLADEQLVPAAKIHVSWNEAAPTTEYIKPQLFVSKIDEMEFPESKSVLDVAKQEVEKTSKINENEMVNKMMGKSGFGSLKSSSKNNSDKSESGQEKKKAPAWFKR